MAKLLLALICAVIFSVPAEGTEQGIKKVKDAKAPAGANAVKVRVHDLDLLDQEGKGLRFKTDAIGDKLVAITFIFTSCETICPVLDAIFVRTQEMLGQRLGRDVRLISMSIDPAVDIPPRLKQYAGRHKAKPGWVFLTGRKPDVDRILIGLDVYSRDKAKHPPAVLVGDGRRGVWRRLNGFPSPEQIIKTLNELEAERAGEKIGAGMGEKYSG
ncbi:MAG: SCO family protein [Nitrospirae bacterium]|nr:SCO family protein [Nitrospirota bacterium]